MQTITIDHRLEAINSGFNTGVFPVRLERRGNKFVLRAKLPTKPHKNISTIKSQRISIGLDATENNLTTAMTKATMLHQQVNAGTFTWEEWGAVKAVEPTAVKPADGLRMAIERFKEVFDNDPVRLRNPSASRSTWRSGYGPYLKRLKTVQDDTQLPLDRELLMVTLETYTIATRSRKACGTVLAAIAKQEGIELPNDWSKHCGGYGLKKAARRKLPTDSAIEAAWSAINNPEWQWVFGMLAAYGLRPSEVFFLDPERLLNGGENGNCPVRVLATSKTGERLAYPLHRHWVDSFGLKDVKLPKVTIDLDRTTLQIVGRHASEAFRRYGVGFKPYDLRHAWAVRAIHAGLSDSIAARMMGHSGAVHTETYHYWMQERDLERGYAAAVGGC